jgi:hypothetical protein
MQGSGEGGICAAVGLINFIFWYPVASEGRQNSGTAACYNPKLAEKREKLTVSLWEGSVERGEG